MSRHRKPEFSGEAMLRWPDAHPLDLDTYSDAVTRDMRRAAFDEGVEWALTVRVEELAQAICDGAPNPGGGSNLIYEDVLEAVKMAVGE